MNGVMILLEIVLVLCYAYALSASSTSGSCSKAVALDIDGVLYRGGKGDVCNFFRQFLILNFTTFVE